MNKKSWNDSDSKWYDYDYNIERISLNYDGWMDEDFLQLSE